MSSTVSAPLIKLALETPIPFLESLMGKPVLLKLKWGWELKGVLQSRDAYMNLLVRTVFIQLLHTEEWVNGENKG